MGFTAGWNMPGYSPESEPSEFDTFAEARTYLVDEVTRFWDQDYDSATGRDKHEEMAAREDADARWLPVHTELHNAVDTDTTFDATCGDGHLAFWITPAEEGAR